MLAIYEDALLLLCASTLDVHKHEEYLIYPSRA